MCRFMLPNFKFNIERWKWNDEYRVYVSTAGRCKDEHKRLLPIRINSSGYCLVKTVCGYRLIHRLVMKTWCPIPDAENLTVDHLDHNKRNNELKNLEWVTLDENHRRAKQDFLIDNVTPEKSHQNRLEYEATIHKISNGEEVWDNAMKAAEAIIKRQNPKGGKPGNGAITKAARRIVAAVEYNKKYLGYNWNFEEE